MAQTNTYDPTVTDRDERRWDRWGRLTLMIGVVLLVWPVLTTLATYRYPSDGWSSTSVESFSIGGPQRMTEPLTTQATPLQANDVVIALDGRPLLANTPPPLPPDLAEGQVIHYTLERAGQTVDVDVTLIRLGPSALLLDQLQLFRSNPGNSLFVFAMLIIATTVFVLRPGSLAARYLFLFAAFDFGIGMRTSSDLYAFTYPAWLSFLHGVYGFGWVYIFLPCIALLALAFPVRKWPARRFPRLLPFRQHRRLAATPVAVHRRFDAGRRPLDVVHCRPLPARPPSRAGLDRPPLQPHPLRRREDARTVRRHRPRRDRLGRADGRTRSRHPGDDGAGTRVGVAAAGGTRETKELTPRR